MRRALVTLAAMAPALLAAQSVQLSGQMGSKALLVIDGQPTTLAVGETRRGVTLKSIDGGGAVVEWAGRSSTLTVGGAPVRVGGGGPDGSGRQIVLSAGPGGHFMAQGAINGRAVRFMVDTGATTVALGRSEAERLGVDWKRGEAVSMGTAGGVVQGHRLTLTAVTVGTVTLSNVEAVVMPAAMPFALLGNSFLSRFQMRRENDVMRLDLR
jgi:aspartyl protease family protein